MALAPLACNGALSGWSASEAGAGWQSGIIIDELPQGYRYVQSEGTSDFRRSAVFHVFRDGSNHEFAIGRRRFPDEYPLGGDVLEQSNDSTFWLVQGVTESRVYFLTPSQVRIEVVSSTIDVDQLLEIAKSVRYEPSADSP